MIEIKHLRKEFEDTTPLKDVNLTINDGDVIAVIGPSGTGKSTLLRCINLLEEPTSGEIVVDGQVINSKGCDINEVRKKMGMVFQSFNLFGHLTVIENIMNPQITLLGKSRQDAYDKSMDLLHKVGLASKALNYPDDLSGGQQQRIAIARTLAMDPDIILFDEPTSALDPSMIGEVQSVIGMLAKTGRTMVIVTHEMDFAKKISNRVIFMCDGGIYEDGTPKQIFEHPQKPETQTFINRLSSLGYVIENHGDEEDEEDKFDIEKVADDLQAYAEKHLIESERTSKVQLALEGIIMNNLLEMDIEPRVLVRIVYSEKKDILSLTILYTGEHWDVKTSSNILFLSLLDEPTTEWVDERMEEPIEGCNNRIHINFRWEDKSDAI
ncbi:MAG: amino acid ABC transporter ATP-binding protein [Bacillota bacterium]|nr:amino acid ABC transporter ATP-binding protein [Bacillota bacterium]